MEDQTDTAQAPPKQSFIEQQLGAAITPAAEREKLNRSFDAFCEELDAQDEGTPEPVKEPAQPVAVEAAPVEQPVRQIALQPAQPPPDPDPFDTYAKQLEVRAHITRHPDFKREMTAAQRAKEDVVREMSLYFDAPPEQIKSQFTDPLLTQFTPDQLTDQWFEEQADLMTKASPITRRKIEAKWLAMREAQERQSKKEAELAGNYDAEQQQRATQAWQAAIMSEARTQLDDESEFRALKDIRDRANKGDAKANAQFNDLEQNVFRPAMIKIMTDHPSTPPGQATRKALRHVKEHLQGRGHRPMASCASQPSASKPSSSASLHKPLPQNAVKSLEAAFDRWTPPPREDGYFWDALTNSYKPRAT